MTGIGERTWDRVTNKPATIYTPPEDLVAPPAASAPLVRDEHGAILGVDWRRIEGVTGAKVPGFVESVYVMPGDRVMCQGSPVTVHRTVTQTHVVRLVCKSDGGAPVVLELGLFDLVHVVEVGAFDKVAQS